MFRALVADAARDGGFEIAAVVDETRAVELPAAVERIVVKAGHEVSSLVAAAGAADAVFVVAPETAGVLAARVAAVRAAGGRAVAPGDAFIRIAADKHRRRTANSRSLSISTAQSAPSTRISILLPLGVDR
jgi:predicted ATP-grasp superfamily ATP-dependent carboligase